VAGDVQPANTNEQTQYLRNWITIHFHYCACGFSKHNCWMVLFLFLSIYLLVVAQISSAVQTRSSTTHPFKQMELMHDSYNVQVHTVFLSHKTQFFLKNVPRVRPVFAIVHK
jgi:hypothetical protein